MNPFLQWFLPAVVIVLGLAMLAALIRAIIGPRTADHVMGINMIGTLAILILAALSVLLRQNWLLDVCLVYAAISFLAVAVLTVTQMAGHKDEEEQDDERA